MSLTKPKSTESSRSWFCVFNVHSVYDMDDSSKTEKQLKISKKIRDLFFNLSPEEIVDKVIEMWCHDKPYRACAVNYEIGDSGNEHLHCVLEDPAKSRFSAIQKLYPGIHVEPTRGSKEMALDYINKVGRFAEKNHTVIVPVKYRGEIKARQGKRNDLSIIEELIEQGKTPNEIMDISISYRQYEKLIRGCFFAKRIKETPPKRDVKVIWHTGESGAGKSYTYVDLCTQLGEENVYLLSDYRIGGFDLYCGEPVLFMDEFKSEMPFQQLLNNLDGYKSQIHCRYSNGYSLWSEIHIASIYPPEEVYNFMVDSEKRERDHLAQLMRRISKIIYHYIVEKEFKKVEISTVDYKGYNSLRALAEDTYTQLSLMDE
ncbi:MAG TPA: hypothetical protein VM577_14955 [Anaerovoracaceae bacterium]|nr:hypothetical protein [Anaerovoracaceae bacterium]